MIHRKWLLTHSNRTMQAALADIKSGELAQAGTRVSVEEYKTVVGMPLRSAIEDKCKGP